MNRPDSLEPGKTGFDFDGVIAQTIEAFFRILKNDYGITNFGPEDLADFEKENSLPVDQALLDKIFLYLTDEPLAAGIRPLPGVLDFFTRLSRQSRITIITARAETAPVEAWLAHFLAPEVCRKIRLIGSGPKNSKVPFVREAGLSAFIDDKVANCLDLCAAGIDARVFHQPWNQGRHQLPCVRSWHEIAGLLGF